MDWATLLVIASLVMIYIRNGTAGLNLFIQHASFHLVVTRIDIHNLVIAWCIALYVPMKNKRGERILLLVFFL